MSNQCNQYTARPWRERLFSQLIIDSGTGCLSWVGSRTAQGYGHLSVNGRMTYVHRLTWELFVGRIPDGLTIDHLCRVRHCASPAHLEPVSQRENTLRGEGFSAVHAAKTHCPVGHPYDEANTLWSQGSRKCRTCHNERSRRAYARRTGEDQMEAAS